MGIRNVFKKKEPTEEELRQTLVNAGITTKNTSGAGIGRQEKFGAFKGYAQQRAAAKPGLAPVNPYANMNTGSNPGGNPYGQQGQSQTQGGQPYGQSSGVQGQNPYGVNKSNSASNPYGGGSNGNGNSSPYTSSPYSSSSRVGNNSSPSPYNTGTTSYSNNHNSNSNNSVPYNRPSRIQPRRSATGDDESVLDLNAMPSNHIRPVKPNPARRPQKHDELDLNADPNELDLNADPNEEDDLYIPEEEQVNSEDEEIESIKQDIRFVKQESVQSTRNTLRMAQEADSSASNTLGMLGSQSERLYSAEQNLLLIDTQTKIAGEKVKELERLNRSIFVPAYGNPFNKKARLRQQEEMLKANKEKEHYMRDQARRGMYESEQRLKDGLNEKSELYQSYKGEKALKEASQRYQFENDSEDDEMEIELDNNLSQIEQYTKKIKNKAMKMGEEVDKQNSRLKLIEENVDKADIDLHMSTARISNIH